MKKALRLEDLVIGGFVLLALLYPPLVALLIYLEGNRESTPELNIVRKAYMFLLGLEDCSPETASQVINSFDRKLLRKLGGLPGLINTCMRNSDYLKGSVSIEERVEHLGKLLVVEVRLSLRERGVVKKKMKVEIFGYRGQSGFKITEVHYEEGY